MIAYFRHRLWF